MADLFGKKYTKKELIQRIGNIEQIGGFRQGMLTEGRAAGTKTIQVDTGVLSLTLLPSRCLDIANATYKGIPFGYISKSGIRNPSYFLEREDRGFIDNFFGGLLTTSGLNNIGSPSQDPAGRKYGLHGEMTNIPADEISVNQYWENDELYFEVKATMHHSRFYGEDILFQRTISTALGSGKFTIHDVIENLDFKEFPLFFLYHINFGFPLVSENSRILCSCSVEELTPRTDFASSRIDKAFSFESPIDQMEEECFYYKFSDSQVKIALENPDLLGHGIRAYLSYDTSQLPEFVEWKMMRSREYLCGFAPGTNRLEGRENALKNESVRVLRPLEKAEFTIEMGIEKCLAD